MGNDEDMTLHATISYCVKQCTPLQGPLSAEQTDTNFFASAGHETLQRQTALYIRMTRQDGSQDELQSA